MSQLPGPRRSRRPSAEVRAALLDAARQVFSERGFSGATTREIAESARTSEAVLFRQFGSKASLFATSVMEPFSSFVAHLADKWTTTTEQHSARLPTQELFGELYENFRGQRDILLALMAVHRHEPDMHVEASFSIMLEQVEKLALREFEIAGWDPANIAVVVRVGIGMLLGTSLFKEWLYSGMPDITDLQIVDGMVDVLIGGVSSALISTGCKVEHDRDRRRADFSEAPPTELLVKAAQWLNSSGLQVQDLVWRANSLRIYY